MFPPAISSLVLMFTLLVFPCPNDNSLVQESDKLSRIETNLQASQSTAEKLTDEERRLLEQSQELYKQQKLDAMIPLVERALKLREQAVGPDHPQIAVLTGLLGIAYYRTRDYRRAEQMLRRTIAIKEKTLGPGAPDIAKLAKALSDVYLNLGDYGRAEEMSLRAQEINETLTGFDDPMSGKSKSVRSRSVINEEYARSVQNLRDQLATHEKTLGDTNPQTVADLTSLASVYHQHRDYALAEQLLKRVISIREQKLGSNHPDVAAALSDLAMTCWAKGDIPEAVRLQKRSMEINERNLDPVIAAPESPEAIQFTLSKDVDRTVWLNVRSAPRDSEATRLALFTILGRKERIVDATTARISALRRRLDPEGQKLLEKLSSVRSQFGALSFKYLEESNTAGQDARTIMSTLPTRRPDLDQLAEEIRQLEAGVSRRGAEAGARSEVLTLDAVQRAIPTRAALIEFVSYTLYDPKIKSDYAYSAERLYAAYVLKRQGEPILVDLGVARPIEEAVVHLRSALRDPRRSDVQQSARDVDERVMRPIRKMLGDVRMVLLSPDHELNLIPFGALVDEQGRYLIENFSFTYLTSGRDLLRLKTPSPSRQGPVIIGNPFFDASQASEAESSVKAPPGRGGSSPRLLEHFTTSAGMGEEVQAVGLILKDAKVLTRMQATERAIKLVQGPSILHVATHGFFLSDPVLDMKAFGLPGLKVALPLAKVPGSWNPLVQSGLALAGANERQGGEGEDGILTGYEAAGIDLFGTKLVVLSACETGAGNPQLGVSGLRQALVLAGAESQVMSLWKVDDEATRDLMINYYKRLEAGEGRSEALRQAQLQMLRNNEQSHPYFWASFIPIGEWKNMAGKEVPVK